MLAKMSLILSVLLFTTTLSEAQILMWGRCPALKNYSHKFDIKSFTGSWYEMIRTKRWVGTEIECVTHDLQMNSKHNISYLTNSYSPHLDREFVEDGDALVNHGPTNTAQKDAIVFYIEEYGTMNELVLLDTDYTSFAVLWSCATTDEDLHFENTMIWARDRVPKAIALSRGLRTLDNNNLTRNYLTYTRHRDCPDFHRNAMQNVGKTTPAMMQTFTMAPSTSKPMMSTDSTKIVATMSSVSMSPVATKVDMMSSTPQKMSSYMSPNPTKMDTTMMSSTPQKMESMAPTAVPSTVSTGAQSAVTTEKPKMMGTMMDALQNITKVVGPNH